MKGIAMHRADDGPDRSKSGNPSIPRDFIVLSGRIHFGLGHPVFHFAGKRPAEAAHFQVDVLAACQGVYAFLLFLYFLREGSLLRMQFLNPGDLQAERANTMGPLQRKDGVN